MSGISPRKPVSIWKRPKEVDFKKLGMALSKGALSGATALAGAEWTWPVFGKSLVDVVGALGIKDHDIASKAWILIQLSLLEAIKALTYESVRELKSPKQRLENLYLCLDRAIEDSELSLTPDFFMNPKDLAVLEKVVTPFIEWSCGNGLSEQDATLLSERLPRYFVFALRDQWRANPVEYSPLEAALSGPLEPASEREQSWQR